MQHRWWREAGEEPSLWSKCRLWHRHPEQYRRYRSYDKLELHELLTLRRFQALEFLHLDCSLEGLSISIDLLQSVLTHGPALKKLTLEFGGWEQLEYLCDSADQVASILVKFEELDLSEDEDLEVAFTYTRAARAVMGGLLKALTEEGAKLKVLTLLGLQMFVEPYYFESIDKLRQAGVKVNVIGDNIIWPEHWGDRL